MFTKKDTRITAPPENSGADRTTIRLHDGENYVDVLVYLKEVDAKNNSKTTRAYCKLISQNDIKKRL
ncbi:MAG: hypothetical protein U9O94_02010 [Nanoarchaeota archaeon]|nr:hypothetical protein [Nanoarchaeota archaeon]